MPNTAIRRALISVSNKDNILPFAQSLHELNIEILSTGGTAQLLREHNLPVVEVADYTGFPEIMDGRIKTLHPKIHGGLLGRAGTDDNIMQTHAITAIDLLVVNLYPFQQVIQEPDCSLATAIENIDIGGPTMLRAGAKNCDRVTVLIDPQDYAKVLTALQTNGNTDKALRLRLARKVFAYCAEYDAVIAKYFNAHNQSTALPSLFYCQFNKVQDLRYGENPQQKAALYKDDKTIAGTVVNSEQLQGKALSYNNIVDAETALCCVQSFPHKFACTIVKHADPCGIGIGHTQLEAYENALATDPTSSFGGVIAFNQTLNKQVAEEIISKQFVEVIIAPAADIAAQTVLKQKPNVRLLCCGHSEKSNLPQYGLKRINGGLLLQEVDSDNITAADLQIVSERQPSKQELTDLLFAWNAVKYVRSNAIVYAKNERALSISGGQTSRVDCVRFANIKANDNNVSLQDAVMASDAFFPFPDGIEIAAKAGISAVIQPGGSIRDDKVITAVNKAEMAMVFTGIRHFRH